MKTCKAAVDAGLGTTLLLSENGQTPLTQAVKNRHFEIVELLLKNGTNPNDTNKESETPLLIAAAKMNFKLCNLLISYGASVDQRSKNGSTPLMEAAHAGQSESAYKIVQLLIEKGADVNAKNSEDDTVLHKAIPCSRKILDLLLSKRPSFNAVNKKGWTPLMVAFSTSSSGNAGQLLEAGADFYAGKQSSSRFATLEVGKYLHRKGYHFSFH